MEILQYIRDNPGITVALISSFTSIFVHFLKDVNKKKETAGVSSFRTSRKRRQKRYFTGIILLLIGMAFGGLFSHFIDFRETQDAWKWGGPWDQKVAGKEGFQAGTLYFFPISEDSVYGAHENYRYGKFDGITWLKARAEGSRLFGTWNNLKHLQKGDFELVISNSEFEFFGNYGMADEKIDRTKNKWNGSKKGYAIHQMETIGKNIGGNDYSFALKFYQIGLKINPNHPDLLNYQGYALFKLGRLDEAEISLRKGVRLRPKSYYLNYNLAKVLLHKESPDACKFLRVCQKMKPNSIDAEFNGDMDFKNMRVDPKSYCAK